MKRLLGLPLRAGNATVTEISGVPAYNPYPALEIHEGMELEVWGVVVGKFKRFVT